MFLILGSPSLNTPITCCTIKYARETTYLISTDGDNNMVDIGSHWYLDDDLGPEWIFLRLGRSSQQADPTPALAERAWELADQHRIYRIVVELEAGVPLSSYLVGQLVLLHKRCHQSGGEMRICGFGDDAYEVLKIMQLDTRFPNYRTREDAVMGHMPND